MEDIGSIVVLVVWLALVIVIIAGLWKTFDKAGEPGWACIIPFYNVVVLLRIAGKPLWWILLMLVPVANLFVTILMSIAVAENFGKSAGFGIGLAFLGPIFYPILGFGDARFQGVREA
ncbi:MAG: signal peptidase I [Fuerstiella sp.]|nr:signal peptidase I [Fuerstiella sp.]MCP4507718.1 signal peptidase I [Fuerstiella sp.]